MINQYHHILLWKSDKSFYSLLPTSGKSTSWRTSWTILESTRFVSKQCIPYSLSNTIHLLIFYNILTPRNRDTLKGNNGDYKQTSNRPDLLDTGGARSNFHLLDTGQMFTMKAIEPGLSSLLHNKIHNLHNLIVTTIRSGDVRRNNENIKERWGFSSKYQSLQSHGWQRVSNVVENSANIMLWRVVVVHSAEIRSHRMIREKPYILVTTGQQKFLLVSPETRDTSC